MLLALHEAFMVNKDQNQIKTKIIGDLQDKIENLAIQLAEDLMKTQSFSVHT